MTSTGTRNPRSASSRQHSVGELVVDAVIVVGSALYLWIAQSYPKDGREIPTVVGVIALVVGIVQLVGWFVPGMWTLTHGNPQSPSRTIEQPGAPSAQVDPADETDGGHASASRQQSRDTVIIMAWAAGFLAAILVLGYRYAVPLFFLVYFGTRRQWKLAVGSAVVMWVLTQLVFVDLLGIDLPTSQFFVF